MTSTPPITDPTFKIGTRKSKLALLQTDIVLNALKQAWPDYRFQVQPRETAGDLNTKPFKDIPTKNLWTQELEDSLAKADVDLIAHSLKGMN
jgi:hydroxymethylbilane synthase